MVAFKSSANRVFSAENVNKVFAPFFSRSRCAVSFLNPLSQMPYGICSSKIHYMRKNSNFLTTYPIIHAHRDLR